MKTLPISEPDSDDPLPAAASALLGASVSRRFLVKRVVALGVGASAIGSLLAACGGDDDDAPPTTATTQSSTAPAATTGTGAATPAGGGTGATTPTATTAATNAATTSAGSDDRGGSLIYAVGREPDRLDPTRSSIAPAQMVFFSIHDCLVARDPDTTFHPWLANSWEISADGLSYTFELKEGVTFHDGEPFNAEAVKYMMDRSHDPQSPTRLAPAAYDFYESTETPDELTAVINLSAPWAPMLDAISFTYRPVSPKAAEELGEELSRNPVGTGPFKFVEWVPNSYVRLVKNPDYNWASPIFEHEGPAYLDEITFQNIPEHTARVAALENDEVQVMEVLPSQEVDRIAADSDYEVLVGIPPGIPYGYTTNVRKPPTDELEVRQAMNYAINQEEVCQTLFGSLQELGAFLPSHGILTPNTFAYEPKAEIYTHDPDKAIELLESAGWMEGSGGIREKNGQPLVIQIGTWETIGVEQIIQQQFRAVGIDLQITVAPGLVTNESARREEIHMSPLPAGRSDPDILALLHSRNAGTGFNFTYHSNAELDDLLDQGASEPDEEKRVEIYSQVQMIIMENAMFLPVYGYDNVSAKRAEVKGEIIFDRGLWPYLYDVFIEE